MDHPLNNHFLRFDSLSGLNCRLFWAYSGRVRQQFQTTRVISWPMVGWLIREGEVTLSKPGQRTVVVKPGQWVFPGDQLYQQTFSDDASLVSIRFAISWRNAEMLFPAKTPICVDAAQQPELETQANLLLDDIERHIGDPNTDLGKAKESLQAHFAIMETFHRWCYAYIIAMLELGLPLTVPAESDPRIETAISYLQDQPFHRPLKETDVAKICGLSVSQLNRLFMQHQGMTPMQFYQDRRLTVAEASLQDASLDIKSIAYTLGFSSPSNFTTWFKKCTTLSPREWRKEHGTST